MRFLETESNPKPQPPSLTAGDSRFQLSVPSAMLGPRSVFAGNDRQHSVPVDSTAATSTARYAFPAHYDMPYVGANREFVSSKENSRSSTPGISFTAPSSSNLPMP